jgi:prefoldin beta subunit
MEKETSNKVEELKVIEGSLQNILMQKQSFQMEMNEIDNAKSELKTSDDEVYKIISGVMLKSDKKVVEKELDDKKKILNGKIEALEKQESLLGKSSEKLRKEIDEAVSKK